MSQKSNKYLVAKIDSFQYNRGDSAVWPYIKGYIKNAKVKRDFETLYYGYNIAVNYSQNQKIEYADSAIWAAEQFNNIDYIGNAYFSKGIAYYDYRDYKKTLDNYLKAHEILLKSNDEYLKNKVLYGISVIKSYLGYYDESIELLEELITYFGKFKDSDHQLYYLRCIYRLGEVYQAKNDFENSSKYNLIGLQKSIELNERVQENYFNLLIGIDDYYKKDYAMAIQNIEKALPTMNSNQNFELEERGNFFLAKSYLGLKQTQKALSHFKKVDSLFVKHKYLDPKLRECYEWLIHYYENSNDKELQLYYVNQLLDVDQINAENSKYLAYKIHKDYDTKSLLETKKKLERDFAIWQFFAIGGILLILIISLMLFFKYRKMQSNNANLKKLYDELLHSNKYAPQSLKPEEDKKATKEVPKDVLEDILNRLDVFEANNEFTTPNIDLKSLAEKFKTNTAYLSKTINSYKKVNFSSYLNRLRINYIIELLKNEPKYRNYTIEALGEISGFSSARQFSDAFYAETGLRPTYFLEQIRKEDDSKIE